MCRTMSTASSTSISRSISSAAATFAPSADFRGHFSTVDLKNYWEVLHVNMVKIRGLQDKIVAKVVQISTLPVQLEGPTVPIRYIMPRGETIELWDSGVAIRTEPGDTVRSVAQRYRGAGLGGGATQRREPERQL